MPDKNYLACRDADLPATQQAPSNLHQIYPSSAPIRRDPNRNGQQINQRMTSVVDSGSDRRLRDLGLSVRELDERSKRAIDHATAAKGQSSTAQTTARQAQNFAEEARVIAASGQAQLDEFQTSQKKHDINVGRQIEDLKAQVSAGKAALSSLERDVRQKLAPAPKAVLDSALVEELRAEIALLKQQTSDMADGSVAFTSLLKDWMKSEEFASDPPLEEGKLAELAHAIPSTLLIKVIMGGIIKLNRDQQGLESSVKADMDLMKSDLRRMGDAQKLVGAAPGNTKSMRQQLQQLETRVTRVQKLFTKQIDLQITEKASLVSKIEAYTELVRCFLRKQGAQHLTVQEDLRLTKERDQIYQWTGRYLNLLTTGPSATDTEKMDKYEHNIMTMEQMIQEEGGAMGQAKTKSLLGTVQSNKNVAQLTRETLDSIPIDQGSVGPPLDWQRESGVVFADGRGSSTGAVARRDLVPVVAQKRALSIDDIGRRFGGDCDNGSGAGHCSPPSKRPRRNDLGEGLPY